MFNGSLRFVREWFGADNWEEFLRKLSSFPGNSRYQNFSSWGFTVATIATTSQSWSYQLQWWQLASTILMGPWKTGKLKELLTTGATVDKPIQIVETVTIIDNQFYFHKVVRRSRYSNRLQLQGITPVIDFII